jgi:hypothetical protein
VSASRVSSRRSSSARKRLDLPSYEVANRYATFAGLLPFLLGYDLRLECTLLYLRPELHPGQDLWQRGGQGERVEAVMIARCPKF